MFQLVSSHTGSDADEDDFLARNGLRYGKVYGYAIDMSVSGPTGGEWRDGFHKSQDATNGASVPGKWIGIDWMWDGVVRDYHHDGAWHFQIAPPNAPANFEFWTAAGPDAAGKKMEHNSPDPREDITGFVQGSTAGYFGHYYVENVLEALASAPSDTMLPAMLDGTYFVYQGELEITDQIVLGMKGQYAEGKAANINYSGSDGSTVTKTFEDIDGFEVIHAKDDKLYAIIQEDSGSYYGERMFISSPLEHVADGEELKYYFVAMSGGAGNTRMAAGVGIPKGTSTGAKAHEFSGVFDLSGMLLRKGKGWEIDDDDDGYKKRRADAKVDINDKYIMLALQASNMGGGVIGTFNADRGGQWLCYQPDIPE